MSIDPKTLPADCVAETTADHFAGRAHYLTTAGDVVARGDLSVLRVFVPVPDGMTVDEATNALTEHVAWVPLPDGPTKAHIGKRARWIGAVATVEAALYDVDSGNSGYLDGFGALPVSEHHRWFIHPDDVPADPDAELNRVIEAYDLGGDTRIDPLAFRDWLSDNGLAVVREREAGTR